MGYIKKHDFKAFGWYRIVLGVLVLGYFVGKKFPWIIEYRNESNSDQAAVKYCYGSLISLLFIPFTALGQNAF